MVTADADLPPARARSKEKTVEAAGDVDERGEIAVKVAAEVFRGGHFEALHSVISRLARPFTHGSAR